jgi:predicted CoA-binding protein
MGDEQMDDIEEILRDSRVVAIVGASPKEDRPSYRVFSYLKSQGYDVIPVNPACLEVLGEMSYPDLLSLPRPVDVVDIFRRSEDVSPIVEQAIQIKAKVVWMQEGIVNETAAQRARQAGLKVVMDHCIRKEHLRLKEQQS